ECYSCHSAGKKVKGGLLLDTRAGLLKGGDSGPALVPSKPADSLLIKAVHYDHADLKMPPKGKLPAATVADLEKWIQMGAPDPRGVTEPVAQKTIDLEQGRKFWAYQPPRRRPLPAIKNAAWPAGDIDRFVLAGLEAKKIAPAPDAARA